VQPFDAATLYPLYPNHGSYVSGNVGAANALKRQGFLLESDARTIINEAVGSEIGR
jgi:hypothetical protein